MKVRASEIERGASAIVASYERSKPGGAFLVRVSGIDGSRKGYLTREIVSRLERTGVRAVAINVDGWLNLPEARFRRERPAERFYEKTSCFGTTKR